MLKMQKSLIEICKRLELLYRFEQKQIPHKKKMLHSEVKIKNLTHKINTKNT